MRRKITALFIAGAIGLSVCGVAAAQWFVNQTQSSVTTAAQVWTFGQSGGTLLTTGAGIQPGSAPEVKYDNVNNQSASSQNLDLAMISATFDSDSNGLGQGLPGTTTGSGGVYDIITSAYVDACPASNFTVVIAPQANTGSTMLNANPTTTVSVPAAGFATVSLSYSINLTAPTACESLQPAVTLQA
jgi:hypothetical protein